MAGAVTELHNDWVKRVLGITLPPATGSGGTAPVDLAEFQHEWADAVETWRDAIEAVDGQMSAFATALRASGDPWLERIADFGLNAVTGNFKVRMMSACMGVSGANARALPARVAEARGAVGAFASHVASSDKVAACDENDLGVTVSIRKTLGPALKGLSDALKRAPA